MKLHKHVGSIVIALLFASSALFMAFSTESDTKADKALLFSLVEFERSNYLLENSLIAQQNSNKDRLNMNNKLTTIGLACSLAHMYKQDSESPNQELLDEMIDTCFQDNEFLEQFNTSINLMYDIDNQSTKLVQLATDIRPLEKLNQNLEEYHKHLEDSKDNKIIGIFLFGMGIFISILSIFNIKKEHN